jgi:hypothetical protein
VPIETTIRNERLKLAASGLNTLGTASITAGVLSQFAAVAFDLPARPTGANIAVGIVTWTVLGLYLHGLGQWVLGGLRE